MEQIITKSVFQEHVRIFLLCLFVLVSCEVKKGKDEYESAKALLQTQPQQAVIDFERLLKVYPNSPYALKASLNMQEFCPKSKACQEAEIVFLKYIIEKDTDQNKTILAMKRLSDVFFERGYYQQVIDNTNLLLSKNSENDFLEQRLQLAKSYFYLRNFYQAEVELNTYIKNIESEDKRVDGLMLKAEILGAQKKYTDAVEVYKEIKSKYKEVYLKNQVFINEALMFEEQKQLDLAIATLEEVQAQIKNAEFVQIKIEKLKERKALMPGASGLKK